MDPPAASCRLCLVEIGGEGPPTPSCTVGVRDGMEVKTDTPAVRRLQRSALRLLLSVHRVDCAHCPANRKCELQRIARFLKVGLRPKGLEVRLKDPEIDHSHPLLDYYPNRCVLCGRCIAVSGKAEGKAFLTFAKRGFDTIISSYGAGDMGGLTPETAVACADICPVGALIVKI
jgi:bidirectional [NiFe] hydrogenase diaphorase subunit